MLLTSLQQDLIERLIQLDKQFQVLSQTAHLEKDITSFQSQNQQVLSKRQRAASIFSFIAFAVFLGVIGLLLSTIIGGVAYFDPSKNAFMILVTMVNVIQPFMMNLSIAKLEQQQMLLDVLEKTTRVEACI